MALSTPDYLSGMNGVEGTKSLGACSFLAVERVERAAALALTCLPTILQSGSCSSSPFLHGAGLVSSLRQTLFFRHPPPLPLPCHGVVSRSPPYNSQSFQPASDNDLQPAIPPSLNGSQPLDTAFHLPVYGPPVIPRGDGAQCL
jgi:hypothetical protein